MAALSDIHRKENNLVRIAVIMFYLVLLIVFVNRLNYVKCFEKLARIISVTSLSLYSLKLGRAQKYAEGVFSSQPPLLSPFTSTDFSDVFWQEPLF